MSPARPRRARFRGRHQDGVSHLEPATQADILGFLARALCAGAVVPQEDYTVAHASLYLRFAANDDAGRHPGFRDHLRPLRIRRLHAVNALFGRG
jgi:hypothetical protein